MCSAHTPFAQWAVYRQRHLVILTDKSDAPSFNVGQRVVELLAHELPASSAKVARAPNAARIASLLSTKQLDAALLRAQAAVSLRHGLDPFAAYGPMNLVALLQVGEFVLVCRDDMPATHAEAIATALLSVSAGVDIAKPAVSSLPVHAGALSAFAHTSSKP